MFGRFRRPRIATAATHDRSEPLEPTAAALTAWQREADALLNAKRYAEARPLYERILAAVPNDLYVIYQLAGALEGSNSEQGRGTQSSGYCPGHQHDHRRLRAPRQCRIPGPRELLPFPAIGQVLRSGLRPPAQPQQIVPLHSKNSRLRLIASSACLARSSRADAIRMG